jgi:hypothetical protein
MNIFQNLGTKEDEVNIFNHLKLFKCLNQRTNYIKDLFHEWLLSRMWAVVTSLGGQVKTLVLYTKHEVFLTISSSMLASLHRKPASTRIFYDSCSAQDNSRRNTLHTSFVNHCSKSWQLQLTQGSGKLHSCRRGLQVWFPGLEVFVCLFVCMCICRCVCMCAGVYTSVCACVCI